MAINKKPNFVAFATGCVLLGLGVTAQPLVQTWRGIAAADAVETNSSNPFLRHDANPSAHWFGLHESYNEAVVDLRDNLSDADVRHLSEKYRITLTPNSMEARANRLYTFPFNMKSDVLMRLAQDPRVEAVEPEQYFAIPEGTKIAPLLADEQTRMSKAFSLREMSLMEHHGPLVSYHGTTDDLMRYTMMPPSSVSSAPGAPTVISEAGNPQYHAPTFRFGRSSNKPNDPLYDKQWNFPMIGVEEAWHKTKGKGVVVAVIDTGVAIGKSAKGAPCKDFGDTAFTDGYNFVSKNADYYDDHGHGTHVAGTIAESTNNAIGLAGIAPEATIMPLKVLSAEGYGNSADIADSIRYAADHGANVINMSLGSAYPSDVIHKAVKYARKKGVTIVCAAGNGFGEPVGYPAAYPECIAVSSVGPTGNIAFYSSYGKQVALAAPGGDMTNGAQDGIWQNTNYPESQGGNGDDYYPFQGTSMASPHVAAVAALIESQGVHDPARVREVLTQTATPNGEPIKYGAGILSASAATSRAAAMNNLKLRHLLLWGLGFVILTVGGGPRRSIKLRAAMAAALGLGFFAPDWWTSFVGADSAWNLVGFSALVPMLGFALLRKGAGVKIAGTFALGVGVCLWANWNNATLPFTTATFGPTAALPWTFANIGAALAIGAASAWRAFRATNGGNAGDAA